MGSLNDPEAVRKACADEKRYATRMAKQETATGPDPYDVVFAAVAERAPGDVLEVGLWARRTLRADGHVATGWRALPRPSPTRAWLVRQAHSMAVKSLGDPHDSTDVPKGVPLFTPRFADIVSRRVGNYQANTYAAATVMLDQLWLR